MKKAMTLGLIIMCLLLSLGGCDKSSTALDKAADLITAAAGTAATENPAEGSQTAETPTSETPAPEIHPVPEDDPALPGGVLVMIDNHSKARPQSGLDKADVVFEIMAEGGITRYMALFYTQASDKIGPVRSARYYFVQLAKGMDLPYAHVGGSTDGLSTISTLAVKDLNEMSNAGYCFWRDKSRKAPHNTYTSTAKLMAGIEKKKYGDTVPMLPPYGTEFSGEALADGEVKLTYYSSSTYSYRVAWRWEEGLGGNGGQYRRFINDNAQSTLEGVPLVADTLYILAAKTTSRNTKPLTSAVDIIGEGDALCIVENQIIRGKWVKESAEKPLLLLDSAGQPMKRKVGKTWVQIIDSLNDVKLGK